MLFPKENIMMDKTPAAILDNIKGGVIICNFDSKTQSSKAVYINKGWTEITGYTAEELNQGYGGNPQALVFSVDKANVDTEYSEQVSLCGEYELMYRIIHKSGQVRWIIDKGNTRMLSGGNIQNQSIVTEVTKIKEREERLQLLAQTDQLTDLSNKATFTKRAQTVLNRQCNKLHAVMMLDVDNFKCINDTCGHAVGDKVLEIVATQLKGLFCSHDILGRVGGDEFMILMTDIGEKGIAERKAAEICSVMQNIEISNNEDFGITVSVGVAFFKDGKTFETLFDEADTALYRAKSKGKNRYEV